VRGEAWDDVGSVGTWWQQGNVDGACGVECTHSPLGRWVMMGLVVGTMLVGGTLVDRKWLVAPESRMAHRLMVSASRDRKKLELAFKVKLSEAFFQNSNLA
jgi:hypothetical protein